MKKKHDVYRWPIPACLLIGIGLGMIFNQVAAGTLIGLGTGLLLVWLVRKNKKKN